MLMAEASLVIDFDLRKIVVRNTEPLPQTKSNMNL